MRGFRYQSVGPQFADGKPTGGTAIGAGTIELRQRLWGNWGAARSSMPARSPPTAPPLAGAWRIGAGVGVRYYTSIGPIRLDVAAPVNRAPGGDAFEVYIGLGRGVLMRRGEAAKWVGVVLGTPLLLVALLLAAVLGGSATPPGRAAIEHLVPVLTDGAVRVSGLSGWLFGAARIARIEVSDKRGRWLTIEGLTLAWSPLRLFAGEAVVQRLAADRVAVARRPLPAGSGGSGLTRLPARIDLAALHIVRLDLAAPVIGPDARATMSLAVDGAARLEAIDRGTGGRPSPLGEADWREAGQGIIGQGTAGQGTAGQGTTGVGTSSPGEAGTYTVDAALNPAGLHATLHLAEPAGGLLGSLAALPAIGAITADATLDGQLDALATKATLTAGPLRARVTGQIDARGVPRIFAVSAEAPAWPPAPTCPGTTSR